LYERVEVIFPLKDPMLCQRVRDEILGSYLADTRKARLLASDGTYSRPPAHRGRYQFSVQEYLMGIANGAGDDASNRLPSRPAKAPAVVYTQHAVATMPAISPHEPATEESENAAV
jgi:polyphosphate kinase